MLHVHNIFHILVATSTNCYLNNQKDFPPPEIFVEVKRVTILNNLLSYFIETELYLCGHGSFKVSNKFSCDEHIKHLAFVCDANLFRTYISLQLCNISRSSKV